MPALPVPGATTARTRQQVDSALPLTALASASNTSSSNATTHATRTGAMIELYNVTLVLPVVDYLALLTLATDSSSSNVLSIRACMDDATLHQATLLSPGIQALLPSNITAWDTLPLAAYTGWGVNATQLIIQPQADLPASITQRCALTQRPRVTSPNGAPTDVPATDTGDSTSSSSSSPATLGIIIGCTVGGTVLLVAVGIAGLVLWRRRHMSPRCAFPLLLRLLQQFPTHQQHHQHESLLTFVFAMRQHQPTA